MPTDADRRGGQRAHHCGDGRPPREPPPRCGPRARGAPAPAPAPVVVAQNTNRDAYEQGRRDQQRRDANRAAPPRANCRRAPTATRTTRPARARHDQQVAAAACHECGVVEAVNAVKVQGQNNGVGAVAGGVGGALVGSRIAGGGNRTLGGVVGAVGGGLLGNAIEKHERKSTMYDVTVRMDDGSHAHGARVDLAGGGREGARREPTACTIAADERDAVILREVAESTLTQAWILRRRAAMTACYLAMAAASASVGADWFIV